MLNLTRKERDRQRKKEEILEAALAVFAEKGFRGATMAEISRASEYPLGTIYRFFQGKAHIYQDLVERKGIELSEKLMRVLKKNNLRYMQRLKECLFVKINFIKNNKNFFRLFISEKTAIDPETIPFADNGMQQMHETLIDLYSQLFRDGIECGEFKSFACREMAILFNGIINSAAWYCLSHEESDENMEKIMNTAFSIFTGGAYPTQSAGL